MTGESRFSWRVVKVGALEFGLEFEFELEFELNFDLKISSCKFLLFFGFFLFLQCIFVCFFLQE